MRFKYINIIIIYIYNKSYLYSQYNTTPKDNVLQISYIL